MHPPPNERELIERTKNGDKQAMSILYETYVQQIFQYISYRVPSEAIAEDLTADVFVRMIQRLPKYQYTGAPLGAWLFRVAANRIADHYRENQPAAASSTIERNLTTNDELGELFEKKEEQSQLREALQTLSEDYQNVLILRFVKDLSHAEVGEIMGKTEGAVRILQHRALKALGTAVVGLTEGRGGHNG